MYTDDFEIGFENESIPRTIYIEVVCQGISVVFVIGLGQYTIID